MVSKFSCICLVAFFATYASYILAGEQLASLAVQPGIVSQEFLFESAPFPACHASTIAETSEGLIAAWFGGTHEKHSDVGIWTARFEDEEWSAPVEVANGRISASERYPSWNPVLFLPDEGPLMLFYKVGPSPDNWWGMLVTSSDGGKSWSPPRRLPEGILGPIKNKPIQLENGDILAPSSSEHAGWHVHFERSTDLGRTWTRTEPIEAKGDIQAIQPSLLHYGDQQLQAIGRTRSRRIFQVWSQDNGKTWEKMTLTSLPNPNSGTDAVTLADGRQLLVYNHTVKGRSPLNVAVSSDGGNWEAALVLEDEPESEFSYPAVIQTDDGLVHITYTWKRQRIKHVVINPAELRLRTIVDGQWPE